MQYQERIGILGAGHIGPVVARLALSAGYPVDIAASGDPDDIALITELVIPGAHPRWTSDAATQRRARTSWSSPFRCTASLTSIPAA